MDTNKGIKILRIVSLTLGILSMLLFLWTRYAKAEETVIIEWDNTTDSMPLPFGTEYYGNCPYNAQEYLNAQATLTEINLQQPYITYYKNKSSGQYYLFWIQYQDADNMLNIDQWNTTLAGRTITHNNRVVTEGAWIDTTNSQAYHIASNTARQLIGNITFSSFGTVTNNKYRIDKTDSDYVWPIGSNVQNLGNINHTFFDSGFTEEQIGEITDIFQETQIIADSGTDTIDTLTQATARNWFQAIINTIWNTANNLVSNFKSFFAPFFNKIITNWTALLALIQNIVDLLQEYVGNDLTAGGIAQVWQTNFESSYVYTLITTGNSIKNALSSLGNTNATAPVITVNLGNNTFFGQTGEYTFTFTWYENIRTVVVKFITAFWLVGLGIHLFTQIPNMIHGVSGTAHGIQNAGGTAIHKQ